MKKDYLWDKSGAADPEIERLESALRVFRYVETDAPALPAKIIPFERKTPRSFFRLALAFAAGAALVMISLGIWFQFSDRKVEVTKDSTETIAPQVGEKVTEVVPEAKPNDSIIVKAATPKQLSERDNIVRNIETAQMRKPAQSKGEKHTYFVRVSTNAPQRKPTVKLTTEEKYAYDQLMLALSVTSSTFKKVKDKVDGVEEKNAVRTGGR